MEIIIVGSGLFGSVCAYELSNCGYNITIVEKRNHIGGNCFTQNIEGINIHKYGGHIFHTYNEQIWKYINKFAKFNNYVHKVFSKYQNNLYSLPFNISTYRQIFADDFSIPLTAEQKNILIDMFIKNYSEKQWQRKYEDIPEFIISRIPFKYTFNNDYFENQFQGIPINGYTQIFETLLNGLNLKLNENFVLTDSKKYIIFTGRIDELFDFKFGKLEFRSLKFEEQYFPNLDNFQYNSVINYPESNIAFTRILEHKHFEYNKCKGTFITKEFPSIDGEPYYPINDEKNNKLYKRYIEYANKNYPNIKFGGRLGLYQYLDMDKTIEIALNLVEEIKVTYENYKI